MLVDLVSGEARDLAPGLDLWPHGPIWAPDGSSVYINADRRGNVAVFRIDIDGDGKPGEPTLLAADGENTCLTPTAESLFVLRSSYEHPAAPFRYDLTTREQQGERIATFPELDEFEAPGILERLCTKASDGQEVWSWLVRPPRRLAGEAGAARRLRPRRPARLVERLALALEPAPARRARLRRAHARPGDLDGLRPGFIERGWGRWGEEPYTDIDGGRSTARSSAGATSTASAPRLMGGSFGGYMANWVAGHTDRFKAIVTHASLWELRGFHGTTDFGPAWEQEFGDPYRDPSRYEAAIPATRLVDASGRRCSSSTASSTTACRSREALRLWTDLRRHGVEGRVPLLPRREPLGPEAPERPDLVRRPCSRSSTSTCWGRPGSGPRSSDRPPRGPRGRDLREGPGG